MRLDGPVETKKATAATLVGTGVPDEQRVCQAAKLALSIGNVSTYGPGIGGVSSSKTYRLFTITSQFLLPFALSLPLLLQLLLLVLLILLAEVITILGVCCCVSTGVVSAEAG